MFATSQQVKLVTQLTGQYVIIGEELTYAWSCKNSNGQACASSDGSPYDPPDTAEMLATDLVVEPNSLATGEYVFQCSIIKNGEVQYVMGVTLNMVESCLTVELVTRVGDTESPPAISPADALFLTATVSDSGEDLDYTSLIFSWAYGGIERGDTGWTSIASSTTGGPNIVLVREGELPAGSDAVFTVRATDPETGVFGEAEVVIRVPGVPTGGTITINQVDDSTEWLLVSDGWLFEGPTLFYEFWQAPDFGSPDFVRCHELPQAARFGQASTTPRFMAAALASGPVCLGVTASTEFGRACAITCIEVPEDTRPTNEKADQYEACKEEAIRTKNMNECDQHALAYQNSNTQDRRRARRFDDSTSCTPAEAFTISIMQSIKQQWQLYTFPVAIERHIGTLAGLGDSGALCGALVLEAYESTSTLFNAVLDITPHVEIDKPLGSNLVRLIEALGKVLFDTPVSQSSLPDLASRRPSYRVYLLESWGRVLKRATTGKHRPRNHLITLDLGATMEESYCTAGVTLVDSTQSALYDTSLADGPGLMLPRTRPVTFEQGTATVGNISLSTDQEVFVTAMYFSRGDPITAGLNAPIVSAQKVSSTVAVNILTKSNVGSGEAVDALLILTPDSGTANHQCATWDTNGSTWLVTPGAGEPTSGGGIGCELSMVAVRNDDTNARFVMMPVLYGSELALRTPDTTTSTTLLSETVPDPVTLASEIHFSIDVTDAHRWLSDQSQDLYADLLSAEIVNALDRAFETSTLPGSTDMFGLSFSDRWATRAALEAEVTGPHTDHTTSLWSVYANTRGGGGGGGDSGGHGEHARERRHVASDTAYALRVRVRYTSAQAAEKHAALLQAVPAIETMRTLAATLSTDVIRKIHSIPNYTKTDTDDVFQLYVGLVDLTDKNAEHEGTLLFLALLCVAVAVVVAVLTVIVYVKCQPEGYSKDTIIRKSDPELVHSARRGSQWNQLKPRTPQKKDVTADPFGDSDPFDRAKKRLSSLGMINETQSRQSILWNELMADVEPAGDDQTSRGPSMSSRPRVDGQPLDSTAVHNGEPPDARGGWRRPERPNAGLGSFPGSPEELAESPGGKWASTHGAIQEQPEEQAHSRVSAEWDALLSAEKEEGLDVPAAIPEQPEDGVPQGRVSAAWDELFSDIKDDDLDAPAAIPEQLGDGVPESRVSSQWTALLEVSEESEDEDEKAVDAIPILDTQLARASSASGSHARLSNTWGALIERRASMIEQNGPLDESPEISGVLSTGNRETSTLDTHLAEHGAAIELESTANAGMVAQQLEISRQKSRQSLVEKLRRRSSIRPALLGQGGEGGRSSDASLAMQISEDDREESGEKNKGPAAAAPTAQAMMQQEAVVMREAIENRHSIATQLDKGRQLAREKI
jgi:hypothetical protein